VSDFPLVSLGQGDSRRDLRPSDIAKKGLAADRRPTAAANERVRLALDRRRPSARNPQRPRHHANAPGAGPGA
jgi:hypothetical protein